MKKLILFCIMTACIFSFGYKAANKDQEAFKGIKQSSVNIVMSNTEAGLILVNKSNVLSENYTPEGLVKANIPFASDTTEEEKYLQKDAAKALGEMFKEAKKEGIILLGKSGYRSYDLQNEIYDEYSELYGENYANSYVAVPGTSEHQTGLAIDIGNKEDSFPNSVEAEWLYKNSYKYGFIVRYPAAKSDITGINYEPWHIRYVGKESAKYIYDNNLTLEEYLMK